MNPFLLLLAVLPGLVICFLLFRIDKYEKEKAVPLLISFFLGVIVTSPAIYLEGIGESYGLKESPSLWLTIVLAFVGVALIEELFKFICLLAYPFPRNFFNEPLDGIVYAIMIGMGFATLENIIYAFRYGVGTTIVRAFTAVPAHAVFAIISGYFVGKAKFVKGTSRIKLLSIGFLAAVALHGLYDFFILQQLFEWLMILSTVTLILSIIVARQLILEHQMNSPFKKTVDLEITPVIQIPQENEIMDAVLAELESKRSDDILEEE